MFKVVKVIASVFTIALFIFFTSFTSSNGDNSNYSIDSDKTSIQTLVDIKMSLEALGENQRANYVEECIQKIDSLGYLYSQVIKLESKVKNINNLPIKIEQVKEYNIKYLAYINSVVVAAEIKDNMELRRLTYVLRDELGKVSEKKIELQKIIKKYRL